MSSRLEKYRELNLDEQRLDAQLAIASSTQTANAGRTSGITLSLPLPAGGFADVKIVPDHVFAPEWEKEYSELKVWSVVGGDKKVISGVVDKTPLGFHAMLELANGDTVFIDPYEPVKGSRTYLSYSKRDNPIAFSTASKGFKCGNPDHGGAENNLVQTMLESQSTSETVIPQVLGQTLNTYRLALATTAEFTQANGGAATTNSRLFTLIARVNQIYLRDLTVKFNLVGGTKIIQTNAATDGYTNAGVSTSGEPWAAIENPGILNNILGVSGYDIGHVLTTGGSGWGTYNSPCNNSTKARATSAISAPLSSTPAIESAAVDMLAHELGHQFGAHHTFNANTGGFCASLNGQPTRDAAGAVEPGAGTTIMSYAGNCESNNISPAPTNSSAEAMFHAHSLQFMTAYAHNGGGNTCATHTALINANTGLTNRNPVMTMPASAYIPARTPFTLPVVAATDADGDPISYAWDQYNVGGNPTSKNQDKTNSALIRSRLPQYGNSLRTIPMISELLAGRPVDGEYLPITSRALNFRLVARDNRGGVSQGAYTVNVKNTGSAFSVPATSLPAGQLITPRWNVAGTNLSPINCSQVSISLINSAGTTYYNLGTHANTGATASAVRLPATIQTGSRVKVACSTNIFFAISGTNPAVAAP